MIIWYTIDHLLINCWSSNSDLMIKCNYHNKKMICLFVFVFLCLFACFVCLFVFCNFLHRYIGIDDQIMINNWSIYDQQVDWLMINCISLIKGWFICLFIFFVVFTVTKEWLLHNQQFFNWLSIFDQLIINTWSTDDQHLIKWRWTVYQLMITDESTVHQLYNR